MKYDQYKDGPFIWFTGVVEDIADPEEMGRVRVRCFGFHTDNKELIPTEALPWACVMTPITNAAMTGIGQSATGILQGSWVIGFFRDGKSAQDPLVLGTIPSSSVGLDPSRGFFDPDGMYPHRPGEIDTPVESTSGYKNTFAYNKRTDTRQENIETAIAPNCSTTDPKATKEERATWSSWNIDDIVQPNYPKNHANHSESGHVHEIDDTPGSERLFRMHKSGTYEEINAKGDRTTVVRHNDYEIIFDDKNVYVKGNVNLTVDGNVKQLIKGDYNLEVEGDYTQNIKGNSKIKIGQSEYKEISFDQSVNILKNCYRHIGKDHTELIDGNEKVVIGINRDHTINGNSTDVIMKDAIFYVGENYKGTITKDSEYNILANSKRGIGGNETVTIIGNGEVVVGANQKETVSGNSEIGIRGTLDEQVEGNVTETYNDHLNISVNGNVNESISGNVNESISGNQSTSANSIAIDGGPSITLSASSIDIGD